MDNEKLLYKLILQFAFYTQGSNSRLDPHLVNISKSLKRGLDYHQLTPELISLSKTLAQIPIAENQIVENNNLSTQQQQKYFLSKITDLLNNTNIPIKFQDQCSQLKQQCKAELDELTFRKIIDSGLSLLLEIKDFSLSEQQGVETFLAELPMRLNALQQYNLHASKSNKLSIENRGKLSHEIDQQLDNIKNSTTEVKELISLQQYINDYLEKISSQLHKHKDREDTRQLDTQKQLDQLTQKLQDLEDTTNNLRINLKKAHGKASSDPLTGLSNRLAYDERIILEYNRWSRYKTPLTIIIWDIDLFKLINDNYGHKAGDKTLVLVAQLILKNSRETDFISRYGGEEFVMLLPNTSIEQALIPAEKIRSIIDDTAFNHNSKSINLTISCGISEFFEGDTIDAVFERADKALYISKKEGRNMCSIINK